MPITPIDTFNHAISRADHFLTLYDVLHNSRQRGIRTDWRRRFNKFMGWPTGEAIERIDGKDKNSILILRETIGVSREKFTHDYCSELLRSAIASSVSALDRYLHDAVVSQCLILLSKREAEIPKKLKTLRLPVLTTRKALEKLRKEPKSRPGAILKKEIQTLLHREHTFQSTHGIEACAGMLGLKKVWSELGKNLPTKRSGKALREALDKVVKRRHQIVHESDLILQVSASRINARAISRREAVEATKLVKDVVVAFEEVLK